MIKFIKPAKTNRRWTDEDIALLRELVQTETVGTIALRLGRTRMSIESRVRDLGLTVRSTSATISGQKRTQFINGGRAAEPDETQC